MWSKWQVDNMTFCTQRCSCSLECLGYAQIPSMLFRYPESNRLAWTREQLSPAEREAKFFWQVTTKGFLSYAEALQCTLDPWGSTRNWWDRWADWLVITCQFLRMQVCLHCLSRKAQNSLWSNSGSVIRLKGELRIIFETKLEGKGFNCSNR